MAKGSSAKKVARAARAGGGRVRGAGGQRNFLFPSIITTIVVLGIALIVVARDDYRAQAEVPPLLSDHWHAAYGIYLCDSFQPDLPEFPSQLGLHTHGDGVIHIHPHSANAAGSKATIGTFLDQTDVEVDDSSLTVGDKTYENGDDCNGKPGRVVLAKWDRAQDPEEEPQLITDNILDVRFRKDAEAYTLAFVPEGTEIPKPASAEQLESLGAVDAGAVPPEDTTTTTAEASTTSSSSTASTSATSSTGASSTTSP